MKIRVRNIKPGMVIGVDRGDWDVYLVIAVSGSVKVKVTHFGAFDAGMGKMVTFIDGNEKVKVYSGKKRDTIVKEIKKEIHRKLWDVQNHVDLVRLVEEIHQNEK